MPCCARAHFTYTTHTILTLSSFHRLAAQTAASFATQHPDCSILAARISVSNLHKMTHKVFSEVIELFYQYTHPKTGEPAPLVSKETYDIVMEHRHVLDAAVIHDRDFELDYFGFKTLGKILSSQGPWRNCRTSTTHAHASGCGNSWK